MVKAEQSFFSEPVGDLAKTFGAFYTDAQIADFLVWWAIRSHRDTILDPSFGGGVFLRSASVTIRRLGGEPADQVHGVEIDPDVHAEIGDKLSEEFGVMRENLLLADFFSLDASSDRQVDVVVGNPPFIRYHRFSGETRMRALNRAASQGVRLSALSSSWAPFLVHSIAMIKSGGRLAMVVPMEIAHAVYAQPVLNHLCRSFGKVSFLTFRKKLFPDLSEDTLLLLGENKGARSSSFHKLDLAHSGELAQIQRQGRLPWRRDSRMNTQAVSEGHERLIEYLIPKKARELYRELKSSHLVKPLGELADVGIGYVTGANEFFHLSYDDAKRWKIPESYLRPAVRRGRALAGLRFCERDWKNASELGEAGFLLLIESQNDLPEGVLKYVKRGETEGVNRSYKCRSRSPWFCVPHVYQPDGFLTYMSGSLPLLVANDACVVAPNSLHILRLHGQSPMTCDAIAASWQTSLTRLSVEIEGHAMGGGMLKIEPSEAERVLVAISKGSTRRLDKLARELDVLVRAGDQKIAQMQADKAILKNIIGLTKRDSDLLRSAADDLRTRRYSRSTPA
jgi:adenine-specific DNA methylase